MSLMDMVTTLIVVKVSWIYTYVKTYQSIHIKYVPYSVLQLYLSKVGGNGIKRNKEQQRDLEMSNIAETNIDTQMFMAASF